MHRDPAFIITLLLLVALVTFMVAQRSIVEFAFDHSGFDRPLLQQTTIAAGASPIDIGPTGGPLSFRTLHISLDFKIADALDHPNLLQTGDANTGVRLEVGTGSISMIVGTPLNPIGYRIFTLSDHMIPDEWHHLDMVLIAGQYIGIKLDDATIKFPKRLPLFSVRNTRIGIGYDNERRFHGDIKNLEVNLGRAFVLGTSLLLSNSGYPWLPFAILLVLIQRVIVSYPSTEEDRRQYEWLLTATPDAIRTLFAPAAFLSLLLVISALICLALYQYFEHKSELVRSTLAPGMALLEGAPHFNSTLIVFILLQCCIIGPLAISWAQRSIGLRSVPPRWNAVIMFSACVLSAILLMVVHTPAPRLFLAAAIILPAILLLPWIVTFSPAWFWVPLLAVCRQLAQQQRAASHTIAAFQGRVSHRISGRSARSSAMAWRAALAVIAVAFCCVIARPMFQAWYPIVIPNDYLEDQDTFRIRGPNGTTDVPRLQLAECLRSAVTPGNNPAADAAAPARAADCPALDGLSKHAIAQLRDDLASTSGWQGEVGRTLFHHSYIFVPAKHFLTFGLDRAVPYLYGYGNTLTHALLMWLDGGATLTSYFVTFPVAELIGMIAIGLVVLLITQNAWMGVAGFALSLIGFYSISYVPVFLAASFSPLRYVGLVLQIASICWCCRSNKPARYLLLPVAATASQFWNSEFALLGLTGQILLLLSPALNLTLARRGLLLALLIACPMILAKISGSPEIVNTVELSFYNVGMPFMTRTDMLWFFVSLVAAQIFFLALSMLFSGRERVLRLCCVPILAFVLVKYIFNPAAPHLSLVYALVWPMLLIYVPSHRFSGALSNSRYLGWIPAAVFAVAAFGFAAAAGANYIDQSSGFRGVLVNDFRAQPWTDLGETIDFVAPEAPIAARVASIRQQLKPNDKLLLLSPYDQVLNFYVNPRAVCGHFDVLSNLATRDIEDSIAACAIRSPDTLIVYDRAAEIPCPTGYMQTESRCPLRADAKGNLTDLRQRLLPFMTPVGSDENLLFYRPAVTAASGTVSRDATTR